MTISKNNWFARYYNWIYDEYAKDLCSFFWGSLLAIGLFFIMVPGRLYGGRHSESTFKYGIVVWVTYGALILFGFIWVDEFGYKPIGFLGWALLCPIIALLFFGFMCLIVVGCIFLVEKIQERSVQNSFNDTPSSLSNWWGAIRGKYCTKITWK